MRDTTLANPPWEHVELKEKEFFAERVPQIAEAGTGAERKRMIAALEQENPALFQEYQNTLREHDASSHFMGDSGRYPLCGRGRINTYTIFAENNRLLLSSNGRMGCVLPSGIATDDTTKFYFQDVVDRRSLVSLYDFENKNGLFPDVHRSFKFCLFTTGSPTQPTANSADFAFFCHEVADLRNEDKRFTLSPEEIALLNPNTRTCPIFRTRADAELTKAIYRRVPVLVREAHDGQAEQNPWEITFKQGLFNMTSDSHLFHTREQLEVGGWHLDGNIFRKQNDVFLPLYEAKMTYQFDHRAAEVVISKTALVRQGQPEIFKQHESALSYPLPRYWISKNEVDVAINDVYKMYLLGFSDVTSATNERTMLASILPRVGVGHTFPLIIHQSGDAYFLQAALNSFGFDFIGRQKLGGIHYTYFILRQLPMLSKKSITPETRIHILSRVLELTYTAWDLLPFARDCGYDGPPFHWEENRRFILRCELDAAFFHLYLPATVTGEWQLASRANGAVIDETQEQLATLKRYFPTPRDAVAYIMETFPIVKRKDEAEYNTYRTKDKILQIYDALAEARRTGRVFVSELMPPPAAPACAHAVAADEPTSVPVSISDGIPAQPHYQDTIFALPTGTRHSTLAADLYTRYWMHSSLHLEPAGMSADQLIDSFRLMLTRDSRKATAQAGDKDGDKWFKSFNQTGLDLSTMLASLLNRVRESEIKVSKVDGAVWLTASPAWKQSSTDWIRADAEIALRAMLDVQLKSNIIAFIPTDTTVQDCITELLSNAA